MPRLLGLLYPPSQQFVGGLVVRLHAVAIGKQQMRVATTTTTVSAAVVGIVRIACCRGWASHRLFPARRFPAEFRHASTTANATTTTTIDVESLSDEILRGSRTALSRAITLVESSRPQHHLISHQILTRLLEKQAHLPNRPTFRIGITGPPGAGKSTLIEALGNYITRGAGLKVAVLAVDPSSTLHGGSILGDKTRMTELSHNEMAFVRPSPTRGFLGGVTATTYEAMLYCESAGYDVTLIETVGVGQSETVVSQIADMLTLVVPPAAGDALQGIKKGISELADLIVVNKADGNLLPAARAAVAEYSQALHYLIPRSQIWIPRVIQCSSLLQMPGAAGLKTATTITTTLTTSAAATERERDKKVKAAEEEMEILRRRNVDDEERSVENVWANIVQFFQVMRESGQLQRRRKKMRIEWMWKQVNNELVHRLMQDMYVRKLMLDLEERIADGLMTPRAAADLILNAFFSRTR